GFARRFGKLVGLRAWRVRVFRLLGRDTRLDRRKVGAPGREPFLRKKNATLGLAQRDLRLVFRELVDPAHDLPDVVLRESRTAEGHARLLLAAQALDERAFLAAAWDCRRTVQDPSLQDGLLGLKAQAALLVRLVAEEAVLLEDRLDLLLETDARARGRAFLAPVRRGDRRAI